MDIDCWDIDWVSVRPEPTHAEIMSDMFGAGFDEPVIPEILTHVTADQSRDNVFTLNRYHNIG